MSSLAPRLLVVERASELAAQLGHSLAAAGAVVKACPDIGAAEAHLARADWDVVVAGPSCMHPAGLRRLAGLHDRYPWVATLLAVHERPKADLVEIVRSGASDLLPLHAGDDELRRALFRAIRVTRARLGIMADGPGGDGRGRVVMVASASGGCGKTFLATNAAEFLARTTGEPVVLLDLDLQFGEVSTALRLRPAVTITDALAAEAEGYDLDDVIDDYLLHHPDGFRVLAAPRQPAEADSVTPGDVARILDVLRARRAWVVIDTHEGLSALLAAALDATDHVFAVATPDRPSLVNLTRYLGALERLGMQRDNVSVIVNKADADTACDGGQAVIPYSRDVTRSINTGVPLVVAKPKSPITALLNAALAVALRRKPLRAKDATPPPAPLVATRQAAPDEPADTALTVMDLVHLVPLDDQPVEIDLTDTTWCRGRSPPSPISSHSSTGTSPALATK